MSCRVNNTIVAATNTLSPFALGVNAPGISIQIPVAGGGVSGSGDYAIGASVTLTATPDAGYWFTGWSEGGVTVSNSRSYIVTMTTNRVLSANFALMPKLTPTTSAPNTCTFKWPASATGWVLQERSGLTTWVNSIGVVASAGTDKTVTVGTSGMSVFLRLDSNSLSR